MKAECSITGKSDPDELVRLPKSAIPGAPRPPHATFTLFFFHESCTLKEIREWAEQREWEYEQ